MCTLRVNFCTSLFAFKVNLCSLTGNSCTTDLLAGLGPVKNQILDLYAFEFLRFQKQQLHYLVAGFEPARNQILDLHENKFYRFCSGNRRRRYYRWQNTFARAIAVHATTSGTEPSLRKQPSTLLALSQNVRSGNRRRGY